MSPVWFECGETTAGDTKNVGNGPRAQNSHLPPHKRIKNNCQKPPPLHKGLWAVAHHAKQHACGRLQAVSNGMFSVLRCSKPSALRIRSQCFFAVPKHEWQRLVCRGLLFALRCHHLQQSINTNRVIPISRNPVSMPLAGKTWCISRVLQFLCHMGRHTSCTSLLQLLIFRREPTEGKYETEHSIHYKHALL